MKKSLKIFSFFSFLFLMSFGFAVTQGFGQILSDGEREVWKQEEAYYETLKNNDLKGHMVLWHNDSYLWAWNADYPNKKATVEKYLPLSNLKIESYKLLSPIVNMSGNIAIVYLSVLIEWASGEPPSSLRVIHVWTKQDRKWLLIGGMNNKI